MVEENNHIALMFKNHRNELVRVSPKGMNIRSRVHEYGGLAYGFNDQTVFYSNFADQCLIKQPFDQLSLIAGDAEKLTDSEDAQLRYCDILVDEKRMRLICVREDHRSDSQQAANSLVAIDFNTGAEDEILFQGSDFVTSPALSNDGNWLAFVTWNHPNMPWDDTQIRIANVDKQGGLGEIRQIQGLRCSQSLVQTVNCISSPTGRIGGIFIVST